jgi:hypothetical protein
MRPPPVQQDSYITYIPGLDLTISPWDPPSVVPAFPMLTLILFIDLASRHPSPAFRPTSVVPRDSKLAAQRSACPKSCTGPFIMIPLHRSAMKTNDYSIPCDRRHGTVNSLFPAAWKFCPYLWQLDSRSGPAALRSRRAPSLGSPRITLFHQPRDLCGGPG